MTAPAPRNPSRYAGPGPCPLPWLRRAVLAASVLDDIDLTPRDDGVVLAGASPVTVAWPELAAAVAGLSTAAGSDQAGEAMHARVAAWLRTRRTLAALGAPELARRARPVGLPVGHHDDPGTGWVRSPVLGGVLRLGLGYLGIGRDPDRVELLVDDALLAAGTLPQAWWPAALDYLERMGAIAAARLTGPGSGSHVGAGVIRPVGDVDVITLLGSATLRAAIAGADGTGMRAVAVPMRRRGWLDLRAIDPAFAPAAAAATDPAERGFTRPVLVTADEVTLAPPVGDVRELSTLALRDPAPTEPVFPSVLYR